MSSRQYVFFKVFLLFLFQFCQTQSRKVRDGYQFEVEGKKISLNCSTKLTNSVIQLVVDYVKWRNISMLYIVDESISTGCNMKAIKTNLDCFNSNGISISLLRKLQSKHFHQHQKAKQVLVVSFFTPDVDYDDYLEQVNLLSLTKGNYLWLNIYTDFNTSSSVESALEHLSFSSMDLAIDMIIAFKMPKPLSLEEPSRVICSRKNQIESTGLGKQEVETHLPFLNNTNTNSTYRKDIFYTYCKKDDLKYDISYCILQAYKIRKSENSSLAIRPLGFWYYESGTERLKPFQTVETRTDFFGFPLIFGKKRFSQDASVADESIIEDDNDEENMAKILDYLVESLNAKAKVIMYPTLGLKGATGNWSGLLGAVVQQEVDLGLDSVIKVPERYNDMSFTQNIMWSIRNIYLKPEESHTARDIFLQPFKPQLMFSVVSTVIIFAAVMSLYIIFIKKLETKNYREPPQTAVSDAVLWSCSVISMQGSPVQTKSYSGKLIVVISLLFALIIYNSYSAFITSILSVKLTQIQSVEDLLKSDYDIGYTKNSQDEIFLRSMNNESQLNQIYLRGYLHNSISNITDGLLKATEGGYGFFATGHIARKQILQISGYKCRYDIKEIEVKSTMNSVAFPMARQSPYRKVINLCLIKMSEAGIHNYIESLIQPSLPKCEKQKSYQSARLTDLTTSFALLGIGLLSGIAIVIMECFWKKKKIIYSKLRGNQRALNRNMPWIE